MIATWRVKDFSPGEGIGANAQGNDAGDAGWVPVAVPGDLHLALHAAGRLPDPHGDRNEEACRWMEAREWWWRGVFDTPPHGADERLTLIFHGIDTFATIWLNGEVLGRSSNMFLPVSYDVTMLIRRDAPNVIAVCCDPTAIHVADRQPPRWGEVPGSAGDAKRNIIRKAQFGWGWDWGPRLPTVGLWCPVELKISKTAAIASVYHHTLSIGPKARLRIDVALDIFAQADELQIDVVLKDPDGQEIALCRQHAATGEQPVAFEIDVEAPQLWWTHDLGTPALYTLQARLSHRGAVLDEQEQHIGIRTIELDTSPDPDEPGTSFFRFCLNGVPIFARGVCWIPASSFVGALDESHYQPLLQAASDANMNMIRVWGGGIYEHDAFFDLCDRMGLLVWQDFMFACAPYPEDDAVFVESVRAEVASQIARLRHHPSLALWCGNNENQMIQSMVNEMTRRDDTLAGALFYDEIIPNLTATLDPATPYWPGSPSGGAHANSMRHGDVHDWTVWHGMSPVPDDKSIRKLDRSPSGIAYQRYAENAGRFISEFGIAASPVMETLHRALPPDQRRLGSEGLLNRIKDHPKDKIDAMMLPVTGLPQNLDEYVDFSMCAQAEGLKFGIEHFRRRKPHCSGTLIWQLNDCWPCVSWSIVDYNGFAKAGYFYTSRAYAPLLASFRQVDGGVELWLTNDTLQSIEVDLQLERGDMTGGIVWRRTIASVAPPNSSAPVYSMTSDELAAAPDGFLAVWSKTAQFPDNRMFFAPVKDLPAMTGPVEMTIRQSDAHQLDVELSAKSYAHFVRLSVPHGWTRFSDNFIDLRPGQTRTLTLRNSRFALSAGDVTLNVGIARPGAGHQQD